jgi:hypothetical protein
MLISAILGFILFHLFSYLHDGPETIMILSISFLLVAAVAAITTVAVSHAVKTQLEIDLLRSGSIMETGVSLMANNAKRNESD